MNKIVITGGHLTPAQAVINELKKTQEWEIYYFGRRYATEGSKTVSVESQVIPEMGVKFIPILAGRLQRQFSRYTLPSLLRVPIGFFQSFYRLYKIKPDIVCSFGGYVSVPVVISAWLIKIPILTHEQTITFGLSSKINAFFADKIAVSFPDSEKYFGKNKVVVTGNPLRKEIFPTSPAKQHSAIFTKHSSPVIYVTGGNQGSRIINQAIIEILPLLLGDYLIIHQCGNTDYRDLSIKTKKIQEKFPGKYYLFDYLKSDQIGEVLNLADLIISRSGANTVCEVSALGKPALFIPLPKTFQNEQMKNAMLVKNLGLAEILNQSDLKPETLLTMIRKMMKELPGYLKNSQKAQRLIIPDAEKKIVDLIYELIKKKN